MQSYSPSALVLTLSRRCNLSCRHCIVEAESGLTEQLDTSLIDAVLSQAKSIGITHPIIYGGESFLHATNLLPYTMNRIFENGFQEISLATNGFWGRTEDQADKNLRLIESIAMKHDGHISLGLSVDQYHQPYVPPESIANIILQHKKGGYPHVKLGVATFQEQESFNVVGQAYDACERLGIQLIESNDGGQLYPALLSEFIEFSSKNFPIIGGQLGLDEPYDEATILSILANTLDTTASLRDFVLPKVIARRIDIGEGLREYIVFPDDQFLIDFIVDERVLNAGRARTGGALERSNSNLGIDYLVIAPNGQAYAFPAHISTEQGIIIGDKPLHQVVEEVEDRWFK